MSFVIANNVSSLTAQHYLHRSSRGLDRSLERLASGFKVNRGADGPAALVISEKQRAQISGLSQAIDNSEKAIALVQTAEGALTEINSLLIKVRSLAVDSANTGVNDQDALDANQAEITNALQTIERIAQNTQFGIKKLLDGSNSIDGTPSSGDVTFVRGTSATIAGTYSINVSVPAERATVEAGTLQNAPLNSTEILTINGVDITLSAGLTQAQVIAQINTYTSRTGVVADANGAGTTTRLYTTEFGLNATVDVVSNVAAANNSSGFGTTADSDAGEDIQGTIDGAAFVGVGNRATSILGDTEGLVIDIGENGTNLLLSASGDLETIEVIDNSLVFQIGPNQYQTAKVAIGNIGPMYLALENDAADFASLNDINVTTAAYSQDSIGVIDVAIDEITKLRGQLGAFQQNTLESTANNLRATLENTTNAESVIRDTNFAVEIANFTKHQVLVQAGTTVLSNANQTSQLVLSLLGG